LEILELELETVELLVRAALRGSPRWAAGVERADCLRKEIASLLEVQPEPLHRGP
jgi:hypothetical protein